VLPFLPLAEGGEAVGAAAVAVSDLNVIRGSPEMQEAQLLLLTLLTSIEILLYLATAGAAALGAAEKGDKSKNPEYCC